MTYGQAKNDSSVLGSPRRLVRGAFALAALLSLSCINPNLVNETRGGLYPLAPGDQPFVLVTMINDTTATIDVQLLVDEGRLQPTTYTFTNFEPGIRTEGVLLPYPFLRVALGNLDNPFAPSIAATLPTGLTVQVPFGQTALVAGRDFDRGDTIIFQFVADSRSPSAIRVATGLVDGETQEGPFTRADTFQTITALLLLNGLSGTTTGTTTP